MQALPRAGSFINALGGTGGFRTHYLEFAKLMLSQIELQPHITAEFTDVLCVSFNIVGDV